MTYFRRPHHPTLCGRPLGNGLYQILNSLEDVRIRISDADVRPDWDCGQLHRWAKPGSAWVVTETWDNEMPQILLLRAVHQGWVHKPPKLEVSTYLWASETWGPTGFLTQPGTFDHPMSLKTFCELAARLWAPDDFPHGPSGYLPVNVGPYFLPAAQPATSPWLLDDRIEWEYAPTPEKTIYDFLWEEDNDVSVQ
jgi:hypothetical protein